MSQNCPIYKQKLEDWRASLRQVEVFRDKFLETGDLKLKDEFEKLKQELEANKKTFFDFAYEEVEDFDESITKMIPRINFDIKKDAKNLVLDEKTPWETIEVLSKIPDMETDLTNVKQEYKDQIKHWEGRIRDYSQEVSYSKLQTIGDNLDAEKANTFFVPSLETVRGALHVENVNVFSAPSLKTVGWLLHTEKAKTFSAPSLEIVRGHLYAENATTFSVPSLKTVEGDLIAEKATLFSAESLETVEAGLDVRNATIVYANSLETVGILYADKAETFSAPKLEEVEKVILTKQNFSEFWDGESNFDWDGAYNEGKLVIDEKIRGKVVWR